MYPSNFYSNMSKWLEFNFNGGTWYKIFFQDDLETKECSQKNTKSTYAPLLIWEGDPINITVCTKVHSRALCKYKLYVDDPPKYLNTLLVELQCKSMGQCKRLAKLVDWVFYLLSNKCIILESIHNCFLLTRIRERLSRRLKKCFKRSQKSSDSLCFSKLNFP